MDVKGDVFHLSGNIGAPVTYGAVIALLLILRLAVIRKFFASPAPESFPVHKMIPHPQADTEELEVRFINFPTRKATARTKRSPAFRFREDTARVVENRLKSRATRSRPHPQKIIIANIHRLRWFYIPRAGRHERRYQVRASTRSLHRPLARRQNTVQCRATPSLLKRLFPVGDHGHSVTRLLKGRQKLKHTFKHNTFRAI